MRSISPLPPAFANLDGETALAQATAKGAAIFRDGSDTYYTPGPSAGLPRHTWRGPFSGAHMAARFALAELDAPARRYVTGDNAPGYLPEVEPRGPWNGWRDAHRDLVSLIEADAENRLDDADHEAEGDARGEAQSYVRAELGRAQAELGLLSGCEQLDGADVLFMGRAFFIRPAPVEAVEEPPADPAPVPLEAAARAVLEAWDAPHYGDLFAARESMFEAVEALRKTLAAGRAFVVILEDPDGMGESPWTCYGADLPAAIADARRQWAEWAEDDETRPDVRRAYPGAIGDILDLPDDVNGKEA
jgi:hypothetical protein